MTPCEHFICSGYEVCVDFVKNDCVGCLFHACLYCFYFDISSDVCFKLIGGDDE